MTKRHFFAWAITMTLAMNMPASLKAQEVLAGTLPAPASVAEKSSVAAPAPQAAPAAAASSPSSTVFVPVVSAGAAQAPTTTAHTLPSVAPAPMPSSGAPSSGAPSSGGVPGPAAMGASATLGTPATSEITKSPQTPQIVNETVSRLQKTDPINLDDMIRAQDAINRLDLLLEIEKRQTELKKIRDERNKPSPSAMMGGLPPGMLNLPPIKASAPPPAPVITPPLKADKDGEEKSSKDYAVKRILGTDGRYMAVLDLGSDGVRTVKVGDKLPDGSKIQSISLTEVVLGNGKKSKTLTISSDSYIVRDSSN